MLKHFRKQSEKTKEVHLTPDLGHSRVKQKSLYETEVKHQEDRMSTHYT